MEVQEHYVLWGEMKERTPSKTGGQWRNKRKGRQALRVRSSWLPDSYRGTEREDRWRPS